LTSKEPATLTRPGDRALVAWLMGRSISALLVLTTFAVVAMLVLFVFRLAFSDGAKGIRDFLRQSDSLRISATTLELAVGSACVAL
jgi:hypothetical protein